MSGLPTKVLFLDIDGVLNSQRSAWALGGFPHDFSEPDMRKFDHVAIGLVRQLCEETGASIVLSSSWRLLHSVHECANGLDLPIFDRTPEINLGGGKRGGEIKYWLDNHPEVVQWAIVDDDNDMLPEQRARFVRTSVKEGLTLANYSSLKKLLA